MSKITINCRHCKKQKGCKIKKEFRQLAETFKSDIKNYEPIFTLKCPHKTARFANNEKVLFTVSYGWHNIETYWQCDFEEKDCENCKNIDNCNDDEVVIFNRNGYKGVIEIEGKILNQSKRDLFVIKVSINEFNCIKSVFNKEDLKRINEISNSIIDEDYKYHSSEPSDFLGFNMQKDRDAKYIYFVSKAKFIKPSNL